jgi:hypothetical protein
MAVNWEAEDWGGRVHIAPSLPDDHDVSEQRAEDAR